MLLVQRFQNSHLEKKRLLTGAAFPSELTTGQQGSCGPGAAGSSAILRVAQRVPGPRPRPPPPAPLTQESGSVWLGRDWHFCAGFPTLPESLAGRASHFPGQGYSNRAHHPRSGGDRSSDLGWAGPAGLEEVRTSIFLNHGFTQG